MTQHCWHHSNVRSEYSQAELMRIGHLASGRGKNCQTSARLSAEFRVLLPVRFQCFVDVGRKLSKLGFLETRGLQTVLQSNIAFPMQNIEL